MSCHIGVYTPHKTPLQVDRKKALVWGSLFLVPVTFMDTFAIGDVASLNGFKVAKSPITKVSIRLLVLKISYPKRVLFRSKCEGASCKELTKH